MELIFYFFFVTATVVCSWLVVIDKRARVTDWLCCKKLKNFCWTTCRKCATDGVFSILHQFSFMQYNKSTYVCQHSNRQVYSMYGRMSYLGQKTALFLLFFSFPFALTSAGSSVLTHALNLFSVTSIVFVIK